MSKEGFLTDKLAGLFWGERYLSGEDRARKKVEGDSKVQANRLKNPKRKINKERLKFFCLTKKENVRQHVLDVR